MKSTIQLSPAAQALIEQIHADAVEATLAQLSKRDGVVVLQPMGCGLKLVRFYSTGDVEAMEIRDGRGAETTLYKRYVRPKNCGDWHPSHWSGCRTMLDSHGKSWTNYGGPVYVTDDFGTLVLVEGGAA
jgi:hypothetical protein